MGRPASVYFCFIASVRSVNFRIRVWFDGLVSISLVATSECSETLLMFLTPQVACQLQRSFSTTSPYTGEEHEVFLFRLCSAEAPPLKIDAVS